MALFENNSWIYKKDCSLLCIDIAVHHNSGTSMVLEIKPRYSQQETEWPKSSGNHRVESENLGGCEPVVMVAEVVWSRYKKKKSYIQRISCSLTRALWS